MSETFIPIKKIGGGSEETYSESEIEIGTFLGKKLYRKTIKTNISMSGSDATTYNFGTSGTYLVKATAIFQGNGWMFTSDSTSGYVCISLNGDTGYIAQKITSNTGIYCKAVILEYTKEAW